MTDTEETRKVQRLGSSTLALSLPAAWVEEKGIEKGDALTIRQNDAALSVLAPSASGSHEEAVIHAEGLDAETVERLITTQYVLGRRIVTVESSGGLDNEIINAVYNAESRLMGLGVIEETTDRISIRCSIDPEDFALNELVERIENTARAMREDAIKAFAYDNPDLARRAIDREVQAEKVSALSRRLLSAADGDPSIGMAVGLSDTRSIAEYRSVVANLELMARDAGELASVVLENDAGRAGVEESTVAKVRDLADRVDQLSAEAIEAFVDREYEATMKVRSSFRRVGEHQSAILEELADSPPETRLLVGELLLGLRTSAQYALRNADVASDLSLREDSEFVSISR